MLETVDKKIEQRTSVTEMRMLTRWSSGVTIKYEKRVHKRRRRNGSDSWSGARE